MRLNSEHPITTENKQQPNGHLKEGRQQQKKKKEKTQETRINRAAAAATA